MTAELEKIARQNGGYKTKLNKVNQKYVSILKTLSNDSYRNVCDFHTLKEALISISMNQGCNSGFYTPSSVLIEGLTGIYAVNQDGSIAFSSRIIQDGLRYRVEELTLKAYNEFENKWRNS